MNRLILVGNGFDLAHGMKTSYNDFMSDYAANSFMTACEVGIFQDELMTIEKSCEYEKDRCTTSFN